MEIGQVVMAGPQPFSDVSVTLAPPLGERDPSVPLRGREQLLQVLLQLCLEKSDGLLHVLHGMSGCGKTAVALELVSRLNALAGQERRRRVWWVNARHGVTLAAGLRAVARQAGLRAEEIHSSDAADALWERLGQLPYPWLLVVDEAEDMTLLDGPGRLTAGTGWLRPGSGIRGLVVVTTRHGMARLWGSAAVLHAVRPLTAKDAARVLMDHAGTRTGSASEAGDLAERLGRLPLALRMAGSYLAEANSVPQAFRETGTPSDFRSYQRVLDGHNARPHPAQVVAEAWRMSVGLLHQQGLVLAGRTLHVLASFEDALIPYTLVMQPSALSRAVPGFADVDGTTLWRTLRELAALGLVDLIDASAEHGRLPAVRLHPLIRDMARSGTDTAVALMEQALDLEEVRIPPEDPRSWPTWKALAPHALGLLQHVGSSGQRFSAAQRTVCADAAELAARFLQTQGLSSQARQEFERVLAVRTEMLGPESLETITTQHNLGSVLHDLGDLEAAGELYRNAWHALRRLRGEDHHDTLTARHELGRLLHDSGRLDEARDHLTAVFNVRRRTGGEEDQHTLAARHEMARVLHDQGELHQARMEFVALLRIRDVQLGEHHPRTITTRHNHACVLHDLGLLQEAQEECRKALDARQALYGAEHPRTLATAHRLALVLYDVGLGAEAVAVLQSVAEGTSRVLGPDHPQALDCAELLELWVGDQGGVT
ncbi:tetratricopeptide repeat protein [Streptomyces phaeochromogenes]|uniref:tetratricopeptide repeat protein n=1 Tax=Streptomyces phaeochromogenes TaxID=1923 RepID=UPI002DDAAF6B|nr:tetratricopeptide repeat protein [Streptomyces phaeochromogenes]WRZ26259.1 tetratricopeptide repeat protein [Streptomyces phaeochromogenes]